MRTWHFSALNTSLPEISQDYSSKTTSIGSRQSLPAFAQPFGSRSTFRNYSPPYHIPSSHQTSTGDVASWSYGTAGDAIVPQYSTVGTPSRRQQSNVTTTSVQHSHSAAASLSASEYFFFFLFFFNFSSLFLSVLLSVLEIFSFINLNKWEKYDFSLFVVF